MASPQSVNDSIQRARLPRLIGERSAYVNSNPADYALTGKSANCRRTYVSRLNQVARLFQFPTYIDVPWHLLRHEHVHFVVKSLRAGNISTATINTTLATLRAVSREAFYLGQLGGEDLARILHVRLVKGTPKPAGRHISAREIGALVRVCKAEEDPAGIRDIAIIGLLYFCGLRRLEITQLLVGEFNQTDNSIVCTDRGTNERLCWPDSGTVVALNDWLSIRKARMPGDDTPLFTPIRRGGKIVVRTMTDQSVYNMISKRAKQAELLPCSPNDFRRSFVTNLLDNGVDVLTVQQLAGHSSPATTLRYVRRRNLPLRPMEQTLSLPYSGQQQEPSGSDD